MIRFWYPAREYLANRLEYDSAMQDVLERGDLILRKDLEDFENNLARVLGVKHVVGVASGTDALLIAIRTHSYPGDEVILPSYTFRATVEAVHHAGCIPVLTDIDEDWRKYKTEKTKIVIPVHMEGRDLGWTPDKDIIMIEDSCQAITAVPLRGHAACYSFYPAKILGSFGDGGAIATNSLEYAEELRKQRNHYKPDWTIPAYNSRLDNLQAAVLNVKLQFLIGWIDRRKKIAERYDKELKDVVNTPVPRAVYQDYIIQTKYAQALHTFLMQRGIETMLNEYPFPVQYHKKPKTKLYEAFTLRLPCTPFHTDEEIGEVISGVKDFFTLKND